MYGSAFHMLYYLQFVYRQRILSNTYEKYNKSNSLYML